MPEKVLADFTVEANIPVGEVFARIFLKTEDKLPAISAGQFVQVAVPSSVHGWLRIPISVHDASAAEGRVVLLVQKVGDGSRKIAALQAGEKVNLVLPLGHGFSVEGQIGGAAHDAAGGGAIHGNAAAGVAGRPRKALLAGGGAGLAPLYYLAKTLRAKAVSFDVLLGARDAARLVLQDEFAVLAQTFICTEDGSDGYKGFVTDHPLWKDASYTQIYTCGPTPMMKAVAVKARAINAHCEVSLENTMACGLGACLCCVTPDAQGHHVCVCTDGPVFDIEKLGW